MARKPKELAGNSTATAVKLVIGRPFQKGQSGNPSGRPKIAPEVKELATVHTTEAIETLVAIMRDLNAPAGSRAMAANAILDRGYGKPTQPVDTTIRHVDPDSISDAELLAHLPRDNRADIVETAPHKGKPH